MLDDVQVYALIRLFPVGKPIAASICPTLREAKPTTTRSTRPRSTIKQLHIAAGLAPASGGKSLLRFPIMSYANGSGKRPI